MIITDQKCRTNFNLKTEAFKINFSPVAFDILSSRLYKDPLYAMVRELLCNAYDSQIKAGTANKPISITLPNWRTGTNFIIRDYGTGISHEDIYDVYTCFFSSTKSSSNDYTGCFGLGSKTPFAFTDVFQVRSFQHGKVNTYLCTKAEGIPGITFISSENTDEPDGLEVSVPFTNDTDDTEELKKCIEKFLAFIPEIKTNVQEIRDFNSRKIVIIPNKLYHYDLNNIINNRYTCKNGDYDNFIGTFIKQGQNVYKVDLPESEYTGFYSLTRHFSNTTYVYEIPIGTLQVTPSRDNFREDDDYNKVCKEFFHAVYDNMKKLFETHDMDSIIDQHLMDIYTDWFEKEYLTVDGKNYGGMYYTRYRDDHRQAEITIGRNISFKETKTSYTESFKVKVSTSGIISGEKVGIIFLDEKHEKVPVRKLRLMAETLNYNRILIVRSEDFDLYNTVSKMIERICNIEQLHFDITCQTYDEFNTQVKDFKYIPNSARYKRKIRVMNIFTNNRCESTYDILRNIDEFNRIFDPKNTFIVSNAVYEDLAVILENKTSIEDNRGYYFIKTALHDTAKSQGIDIDTTTATYTSYNIITKNEFTESGNFKEFDMKLFMTKLADVDFTIHCKGKGTWYNDLSANIVGTSYFPKVHAFLAKYGKRWEKADLFDKYFIATESPLCKMIELHNTCVNKYRKNNNTWNWDWISTNPILNIIEKYTGRDMIKEKVVFIPKLLFHSTKYLMDKTETLYKILQMKDNFNKFYQLSKFFRRKKNVLF